MVSLDDLIQTGRIGMGFSLPTVYYEVEINAGETWSFKILSDWPKSALSSFSGVISDDYTFCTDCEDFIDFDSDNFTFSVQNGDYTL
jgi:hypothetical protein